MSDFKITSGRTTLTHRPCEGGRILSFSFDGYEFLTGKDIHPENFGSTFWPSPQSAWHWPPPPVLDSAPYSAAGNGYTNRFLSGNDPVTGFRFAKEFSPGDGESVRLSYSIENATGDVKQAAPWEISRVHKGGILVFPIGEQCVRKKQFEPARFEIIDGIAWYHDAPTRPAVNKLSIADGLEGWMAYIVGGKIFIKKFQDTPHERQAPDEAEVLVYVSSEADYIEIEVQGPYETIKPGAEVKWNVEWIGLNLPGELAAGTGLPDIVGFIRSWVRQRPVI